MLVVLKFRIGAVAKVFGVSEKTLRQWRKALKDGYWHGLEGDFHGPGAPAKLRPDVKRYIQVKYRQACRNQARQMPYGFRQRLGEELTTIWPDQEVSEERLRQIFRDEDEAMRACAPCPVNEEGCPPMEGDESGAQDLSACNAPTDDDREPSAHGVTNPSAIDGEKANKRKDTPDFPGHSSSNQEENREKACDSSVALTAPPLPEITTVTATDDMDRRPPPTEKECLVRSDDRHRDGVDSPVSLDRHVGSASRVDDETDDKRKVAPDFQGHSSSDREENREEACDSFTLSITPAAAQEDAAVTETEVIDRRRPNADYLPLLSNERATPPFPSPHAGFLLLSPWFDQAFADVAPIVRQTATQILCGAVNQEQGKFIDYSRLEMIVGPMVRDGARQRVLLDEQARQSGAVMAVYQGNAKLIDLPVHPGNIVVLYCDSHHEAYTGQEKILLNWSGCQKRMEKGLALDFAHTENGQPFFIGHHDNFDDARTRFFLLRSHVRQLVGREVAILWVFDRGYWGMDFLADIEACGDYFLQWEKGYADDGWNAAFDEEGDLELTRQGNRPTDAVVRRRLVFRQCRWQPESFRFGRRLVVRFPNAAKSNMELAIVSNAPTVAAQILIKLMFHRFPAQENDFSYENRYFGINQLTSRRFTPYAAIAGQVVDRQVDSRAYKAAQDQRHTLTEELKRRLFTLEGLPKISLQQLEAKKQNLRRQAGKLREQLERLHADSAATPKKMELIAAQVRRMKELFRRHEEHHQQARKRQQVEQERDRLREQIEHVKVQLQTISRTESRLWMVIEEQYVRPEMTRKSLVDAVRITSRNVFCEALRAFRPYYGNLRDDHQILRVLTRSSGFIIPNGNRIDVYLLPGLERQPHQWERIDRFLADCEQRIAARWEIHVRFITQASDAQIFHAIERARTRQG